MRFLVESPDRDAGWENARTLQIGVRKKKDRLPDGISLRHCVKQVGIPKFQEPDRVNRWQRKNKNNKEFDEARKI